MKRLFFSVIISGLLVFSGNGIAIAQEESKNSIDLSLDVASGFVWRGLSLNTSPVIQPSFTFTSGRFFIGTWASTPIGLDWGDYRELDIFLGFQLTPSLTIGLNDYFMYDLNVSPSYFNYNKEETCHAMELYLTYDGSGAFPLQATISTIIAGDDLNDKRKSNFSTYLELGYGSATRSGIDWDVCFGVVPMASGFYGTESFHVVNISLGLAKTFEITPTYSLPLSMRLTVNPNAEAVFLTAGIKLF